MLLVLIFPVPSWVSLRYTPCAMPISGPVHDTSKEPVLVQAFIPQPAVKRFNVGVLLGLSWLHEAQIHTMVMAPAQHSSAAKFLAIVRPDDL